MSIIDDWKNPRIQELIKWRMHHESCIRDIDEKIRRERQASETRKVLKELEDGN